MKQNPFKNVGEIHKEWTAAGVSASRTTTHRRMQDMGFSCRIPCVKPLLTTDSVRSVSPGLKTKRTGLLLSGPKLCSLMKVNLHFLWKSGSQSLEEERRGTESTLLEVQCKFPQSVMVWGAMSSAGVGPLCFLRSKVDTAVYQEVLEHFMLPAADQLYGDADFIFQQDLAPAHSAKATSTWFKDHGIPVLNCQQTRLTLTP